MQLFREKSGKETLWDKSPKLSEKLDAFLEMLEWIRELDIDFCPWVDNEEWTESQQNVMQLRSGGLKGDRSAVYSQKYNRYGSSFSDGQFYAKYCSEQVDRWYELDATYQNFMQSPDFPVDP